MISYRNRAITRDICNEYGLGVVGGTLRDLSPLCVPLYLMAQQTSVYKHLLLDFYEFTFLLFEVPNNYPQHPVLSLVEDGI